MGEGGYMQPHSHCAVHNRVNVYTPSPSSLLSHAVHMNADTCFRLRVHDPVSGSTMSKILSRTSVSASDANPFVEDAAVRVAAKMAEETAAHVAGPLLLACMTVTG